MILQYEVHFAFLEFNLDPTIISKCLLVFFNSEYHLIIFLVFNAGFYLLHFDFQLMLINFHFLKDFIKFHFSLDGIRYFINQLSIHYFQHSNKIFLFFLYFIILIQNFFDIEIFKLFKQLFKLFKLLFQLSLILFYNN